MKKGSLTNEEKLSEREKTIEKLNIIKKKIDKKKLVKVKLSKGYVMTTNPEKWKEHSQTSGCN